MAVSKERSAFAQKMGSVTTKTLQQAATAPVVYGQIQLPGGIQDGIAIFEKAYFGQYKDGKNKDKFFFRAVGSVLLPEAVEVDGREVKTQGLQTSIQVGLHETEKKTLADAEFEILNHLKMLGGGRDFTADVTSYQDLEAKANLLSQMGAIYFYFDTRESKATAQYAARVWHTWKGTQGLEEFVPPDIQSQETQDDTGSQPNQVPEEATTQPKVTVPDSDSGINFSLEQLQELAKNASKKPKGDVKAQEELTKIATGWGVTEVEIDNSNTWNDLVKLIVAKSIPSSTENTSTSTWTPTEKGICYIQVWNKATKAVDKWVECEVAMLKEGKAQLLDSTTKKGLVDPKTNKAMGWVDVACLSESPF